MTAEAVSQQILLARNARPDVCNEEFCRPKEMRKNEEFCRP
jgi:hypothetical protein